MLDEGAQVNWWRPGDTTWFTVLHQAAWHGVSADVARELIDRGRCAQTDSRLAPPTTWRWSDTQPLGGRWTRCVRFSCHLLLPCRRTEFRRWIVISQR
nr:ankyrin repeat domain-containing protein [Mycolicibacterium goodii]